MGDAQFNGTPEEWDALVKKNKKKQTAVEWLINQLEKEYNSFPLLNSEACIQALEMEKEQIHASIDKQVNILRDTLDEMMTGFDSEEDKMDFILDICNGYKKRINKSE